MNAIGGGILGLLVVLVVFAPRRWAALSLMAGVLYLTQGQSIDLGVHIYPMRLLGLVGFLRVMGRGEFSWSRFNRLDKSVILAYSYITLIFVTRSGLGYGTGSGITQVSLMDKLGCWIDTLFFYISCRGLLVDQSDFIALLKNLVFITAPYLVLVSIERITSHNPLVIVGAYPDLWIDGQRLRCRGSFTHPSLLGTLGASFLPLYIGLALTGNHRFHALAGIGLCLGIVFLAGSGGPVNFVMLTLLAWSLWTVRGNMALVRRMIVIVLILLSLVMNSPIWYLPSRLSSITGGDGWHRSYLIDVAFRNIDQWWLIGMPLEGTRDWFPYLVKGAVDMTNQFLAHGIDAGLLAMLLYIAMLAKAFKGLGGTMASIRRNTRAPGNSELLLWGLGAMLAGHIANWIGITYFDQIYMVFLMQLAIISSLSQKYMMGLESTQTMDINDVSVHSAAKGIVYSRYINNPSHLK